MTCELDLDLKHLDDDQVFIQSELDTEIFLRLPAGCGRLSGKVVSTQQRNLCAGAEWLLTVQPTVVDLGRV